MSKKVIYKYPVEPVNELELPKGAVVLTVQTQRGEPQMWVLLDPDEPKAMRRFIAIGTGHEFEEKPGVRLEYINTFQLSEGSLIFHLFEAVELST